jgi:DNA polymerase I-like protein with 3'-5' exonuclease and polymerase domains
MKGNEEPEQRKFYKHYRTLAKPTGLGYPGGLGPDTFIAYAKATFQVVIDRDTAEQLRELWRSTFPEMKLYHDWINSQAIDPHAPAQARQRDDGSTFISRKYAYTSPMGMYRAGCDFCAAANGKALQTPSAEGAKLAIWNVVRACVDPSRGSILYPDALGARCRPLAFVHDEFVGEVSEDCVQEVIVEVSALMVEAMRYITPDVKVGVGPALMRRWDKRAEAVFDESGCLTVWEPPDKV